MNYILLSNLLMLGMLTYINISFLNLRFKNKVLNLSIFLLFYLILSKVNFNGASSMKTMSIFILVVAYSLIMFKNNCKDVLFNIVPFFLIFSISEIFTSTLLNVLIEFNESTTSSSLKYLLAITISNIIGYSLTFIYIKIRKSSAKFSMPKYGWFVFILPITTIMFIANINNYYDAIHNNKSLFFILLGLLLSNFIFIFIFIKVTESIYVKKDIEILKYKDELNTIRYDLLEKHYKSNFKFLHDLLNDCRDINEFIEKGDYESLKAKVSMINDVAFKEFNSIYSNSPVLNSVINNYIDKLNEQNISIKTTIEYADFGFISLYDQTELFSLLLDFGIRCCENVKNKERNIVIKSIKKGDQIIIQTLASSNLDISSDYLFNLKKQANYDITISLKYISQIEAMSCLCIFKDNIMSSH